MTLGQWWQLGLLMSVVNIAIWMLVGGCGSICWVLVRIGVHDVLILGAGLAGQRAALAAAETGASVALVSKVHPVRSHSVAAAGGINASVGEGDSWEAHAQDTVKGSDYLGDQDAIEVMCREAPEEIVHMERLGVPFHRDGEGRLATRPFGAASQPRTCYVADITGQALLHVLFEQLLRLAERIDRFEEWFVTRLLLDDDGACVGCIARNVRDGELRVLQAKSVVLATGGAGQCFRPTTNASICTGDGVAQGYRIGAPLMDMEFNQYHPTTLARVGILITEGARGEGAHLYNARGERFMESYAPNKLELASRDVVSRAEQTEINEGRGFPDGTVALDITKVPRKRTLEALREIVNIGRDFAGVDITREPIHICPGMHYMMGGVKVELQRRLTRARPLRRRGDRLRLRARRQPAGRKLAAGDADLRQARRRARRRARPGGRASRGVGRCACRRGADDRPDHRPRAPRPQGLRAAKGAGPHDAPVRRRVPRRERAGCRARRRAPAQRGGADHLDRRHRHALQPGRARRARARAPARRRRVHRRRRAVPHRVAWQPLPHRPSRARRRALALGTRFVAANGDGQPEVSSAPVTTTRWEPEERTY